MDRVEAFLGDRLRGRPVPADLRRLVELQLDGVLDDGECPQPFAESRVLRPGERHGLEGHLADLDGEDAHTRANGRAITETLAHVAVVVDGFNGDLFGYWLHPDDAATDPPLTVKLTTEGEFETPPGSPLVEGMVYDWGLGDDIGEIVEFCDAHNLPLATRDESQLRWAKPAADPALLHSRLYKTYRPRAPRPGWAATVAQDARAGRSDPPPIGARLTDPWLRELTGTLGLPADLQALIRAADSGQGEVTLEPPGYAATLAFMQDAEGAWWLHSVRYRRPTDERPGRVPLPFGCAFDEPRAAARARLAAYEPARGGSAAIVPADRWEIGELDLWILFDRDDDAPRQVRVWPRAMPLT